MKTTLHCLFIAAAALMFVFSASGVFARSDAFKDNIYNPGILKPVDSVLKVKVGEPAPDFTLPAVAGGKIKLSDYRAPCVEIFSSKLKADC